MRRDQFTFYRSFWEALNALPKKDQLPFIMAIGNYVFEDEIKPLTGAASASFLLVKPILDKASKKAESGKQGGSKPKAKRKQTGSKTEANGKQTESHIEGEIEVEIEEYPPTPFDDDLGFGAELTAAFSEWLAYKREKRQGYKPTGLNSLVTQVKKHAQKYGEAAVAGLIRECMAANWQGIIWDKLEKRKSEPQSDGYPDGYWGRGGT